MSEKVRMAFHIIPKNVDFYTFWDFKLFKCSDVGLYDLLSHPFFN